MRHTNGGSNSHAVGIVYRGTLQVDQKVTTNSRFVTMGTCTTKDKKKAV